MPFCAEPENKIEQKERLEKGMPVFVERLVEEGA